MKLKVRLIDGPEGKHVALCDEEGKALPCQYDCVVQSAVDEHAHIVVKFLLDGDKIKLEQ